jgi:hypothetical protein
MDRLSMMPDRLRWFRRGWVAKGMAEIHPYFLTLECACTNEGTDTFAYETG